jgi:hypothetical protein
MLEKDSKEYGGIQGKVKALKLKTVLLQRGLVLGGLGSKGRTSPPGTAH